MRHGARVVNFFDASRAFSSHLEVLEVVLVAGGVVDDGLELWRGWQ